MKKLSRYNLLPALILLIVAIIWGMTFSYQKRAMLHLAPFQFMAVRFFLGGISLTGIALFLASKSGQWYGLNKDQMKCGLQLGVVIFLGNIFQQIGIIHTSVANSGFITTLYVIIVPIILFISGARYSLISWLPACLATLGLFLLSGGGSSDNYLGDTLQFLGAFCWAVHILLVTKCARQKSLIGVLHLAAVQAFICAGLALLTSWLLQEAWHLNQFQEAWFDLLLAGAISTGIANFLQLIAQGKTNSNHAAIILSMEGVFAASAGWFLLGESMTKIALLGGLFIMIACIASQFINYKS